VKDESGIKTTGDDEWKIEGAINAEYGIKTGDEWKIKSRQRMNLG